MRVKQAPPIATHPDGSPCPEGMQRTPRGFVPCCAPFKQHTLACYHDIRYEWWPKSRSWFIIIAPAAGGGIGISFCPHCGAELSGKRTPA